MSVDDLGEEWIVDALGCQPAALQDEVQLRALVGLMITQMHLHPLASGFWHKFSGPGGVTGLVPLQESHIALHTYPERGVATLNLYCCRSGCHWEWESKLRDLLGAQRVIVHRLSRGRESYHPAADDYSAEHAKRAGEE